MYGEPTAMVRGAVWVAGEGEARRKGTGGMLDRVVVESLGQPAGARRIGEHGYLSGAADHDAHAGGLAIDDAAGDGGTDQWCVAGTAQRDFVEIPDRFGLRPMKPDAVHQLAGSQVGSMGCPEEVLFCDLPEPIGRDGGDLTPEGEQTDTEFGRRVGVGDTAAYRAPVAGGHFAHAGKRLRENVETGDCGRELGGALGDGGADAQSIDS